MTIYLLHLLQIIGGVHDYIFCYVCYRRFILEKIYFRDYSSFNKELYLADMQAIDWETIYNCANDLHDLTHDCIQSIKEVINKHAPLKKASLSKMKQLAKPWISKGLLTSIKAKQKLYKSNFFSKDPEKVQKYKQYSNLMINNKLYTQGQTMLLSSLITIL